MNKNVSLSFNSKSALRADKYVSSKIMSLLLIVVLVSGLVFMFGDSVSPFASAIEHTENAATESELNTHITAASGLPVGDSVIIYLTADISLTSTLHIPSIDADIILRSDSSGPFKLVGAPILLLLRLMVS